MARFREVYASSEASWSFLYFCASKRNYFFGLMVRNPSLSTPTLTIYCMSTSWGVGNSEINDMEMRKTSLVVFYLWRGRKPNVTTETVPFAYKYFEKELVTEVAPGEGWGL